MERNTRISPGKRLSELLESEELSIKIAPQKYAEDMSTTRTFLKKAAKDKEEEIKRKTKKATDKAKMAS